MEGSSCRPIILLNKQDQSAYRQLLEPGLHYFPLVSVQQIDTPSKNIVFAARHSGITLELFRLETRHFQKRDDKFLCYFLWYFAFTKIAEVNYATYIGIIGYNIRYTYLYGYYIICISILYRSIMTYLFISIDFIIDTSFYYRNVLHYQIVDSTYQY